MCDGYVGFGRGSNGHFNDCAQAEGNERQSYYSVPTAKETPQKVESYGGYGADGNGEENACLMSSGDGVSGAGLYSEKRARGADVIGSSHGMASGHDYRISDGSAGGFGGNDVVAAIAERLAGDVRKRRYSDSDADEVAATHVAAKFARRSRSIGLWLNTHVTSYRTDPGTTASVLLLHKNGLHGRWPAEHVEILNSYSQFYFSRITDSGGLRAIAASIYRSTLRPKVLQDLVHVRKLADLVSALRGIKESIANQKFRSQRDSVFIISVHEQEPNFSHLHIIHDCGYHSSKCNCARLRQLQRAPRSRRSYNSGDLTEESWFRLLSYLHEPSRQLIHVQTGGQWWRIPCRSPFVSSDAVGGMWGCDEHVALYGPTLQDVDTKIIAGVSSGRSVQTGNIAPNEDGPTIGKKPTLKKIISFFMSHLTAPLKKLIMSKPWVNDPEMIHLQHGDRQVNIALGWVMQKLLDMSVEDLLLHCLKFKSSILFRLDKQFYSIKQSITILVDLLGFQYRHNKRNVIQFLHTVYLVVSKCNDKKNALLIIGPKNCCKSYFINTLGTFFINYGVMESPNRNNNFPFMDCADKRILVWDEASCDRYYYDSIKKLMSGEPLSVCVKFSGNQLVNKTPLIMSANNEVFPDDPIFNCRHVKYYWRSHDPLIINKRTDLSIHPVAIGYMLLYAKYVCTNVFQKKYMSKELFKYIDNVMNDVCID